MKITSIWTKHLKAPLKTPFVTALRRVEDLEDLVIIIECDNGMVGYGEGAPTPQITGETLGSMQSAVDFIAPHLIGKEIEAFPEILHLLHSIIKHNTTAKSALEIALYDLKAQVAKEPLYRMLGGEKKEFTTDITISMGTIEKMVSDSLDALSLGYDTLKIKIGSSPYKDAERIVAIYEALPAPIKLRLDANQGWTPQESVTLLQTIEHRGIIAE
ncbi:MAG: dipeptide epimerase, partial [Sulfurovum sp.]|nr:dipeptide epimerase [Sulfurovum sp.]